MSDEKKETEASEAEEKAEKDTAAEKDDAAEDKPKKAESKKKSDDEDDAKDEKPKKAEPKAESKKKASDDEDDEPKRPRITAGDDDDKKKKQPKETAVRLSKLTKSFGEKIAVDDVSLNIRAGWIYGLIGPNGAGKTTTFSMMAGYLEPTHGTVEILGHSPRNVDALRANLGVLPQDALLPAADKVGEFMVHMARLQNIPGTKALSAARDALAEVGGMDWWGLRCGTLSHGMQKRVALAQALMGDPKVVFLDEPTAGLDPRVAYDVRQLVKSRKGKCTIIISSHNLQELEEVCDAAAVLDHGKLVANGTISALTAASEEIYVKIAPPPRVEGQKPQKGSRPNLPIDQIRQIPGVTRSDYDEDTRELGVYFERKTTDAETVIGATLWILLNAQVRISGVTKGRGLEARVMDLTDD
jgi:ABC-type multidrug transport system ATPase subunit